MFQLKDQRVPDFETVMLKLFSNISLKQTLDLSGDYEFRREKEKERMRIEMR